MRILALLALLVLPAAGFAQTTQPDPGAAYKGYHEAAVQGRIEIARNFTSPVLTKQMMFRTDPERSAAIEKMRVLLPNVYGIEKRQIAPDGRTAKLTLNGKLDKPYKQDVVGEVNLVKDVNVWRVSAVSWRSVTPPPATQPAAAQKGAPPSKPQISTAPPKPATARPNVPPPSNRTLGQQKEPCVFKPAMTAEDLERCK